MSEVEEFRVDLVIKCAGKGSNSGSIHPDWPARVSHIVVNEKCSQEELNLYLDIMFASVKKEFISAFNERKNAALLNT